MPSGKSPHLRESLELLADVRRPSNGIDTPKPSRFNQGTSCSLYLAPARTTTSQPLGRTADSDAQIELAHAILSFFAIRSSVASYGWITSSGLTSPYWADKMYQASHVRPSAWAASRPRHWASPLWACYRPAKIISVIVRAGSKSGPNWKMIAHGSIEHGGACRNVAHIQNYGVIQ